MDVGDKVIDLSNRLTIEKDYIKIDFNGIERTKFHIVLFLSHIILSFVITLLIMCAVINIIDTEDKRCFCGRPCIHQ